MEQQTETKVFVPSTDKMLLIGCPSRSNFLGCSQTTKFTHDKVYSPPTYLITFTYRSQRRKSYVNLDTFTHLQEKREKFMKPQ